ncbi:MAG TPA: ferrochelatase [Bacteroidia bacterium]|nr:ferrochelatase [Bacteroidia bacterium]
MKEGVLLINLGTPSAPTASSVGRYLRQFLNDRRVIDIHPLARFFLVNAIIIPFRRFRSAALYRKIWTPEGSPLMIHSLALKEKLQQALGNKYLVDLAMRYQQPSIQKALDHLRTQHVSKIHILPLYPQYASSSTGSSIEEVLRMLRSWEVIPSLHIVSKFYDQAAYREAILKQASKYVLKDYDHVLFSYHGLPERQIIKASAHYGGNSCNLGHCCDSIHEKNQFCYRANCMATSRFLAGALGLPEEQYSSAFQSRLDNKWLKPYSDKVLSDLARSGKKKVLVFSPAFVADCLETTYEIAEEYNELFRKHGGEKVTLVESLNSDDAWVMALRSMIVTA